MSKKKKKTKKQKTFISQPQMFKYDKHTDLCNNNLNIKFLLLFALVWAIKTCWQERSEEKVSVTGRDGRLNKS